MFKYESKSIFLFIPLYLPRFKPNQRMKKRNHNFNVCLLCVTNMLKKKIENRWKERILYTKRKMAINFSMPFQFQFSLSSCSAIITFFHIPTLCVRCVVYHSYTMCTYVLFVVFYYHWIIAFNPFYRMPNTASIFPHSSFSFLIFFFYLSFMLSLVFFITWLFSCVFFFAAAFQLMNNRKEKNTVKEKMRERKKKQQQRIWDFNK